MATRRRKPAAPTAGQRLVDELARDNDPFSLRFLVEQAGHIADYLERSHQLLSGERSSWVDVKIGAKTVEVQVTNVLVQHRQFTEQLRKLLATIHAQRAAVPDEFDEPDVTAGL
jgi:RecA/RadA recombinase